MQVLFDILLTLSVLAISGGLLVRGSHLLTRQRRVSGRLAALADTGPAGALGMGGVDVGVGEHEQRQERWAARLLGSAKERYEVEQLLNSAGWRGIEPLLAFGLLRLGAPLLFGGAVLLMAPAGKTVPFMALCAAAAAFLAPKHLLRMRAAGRARKIRGELPFTLDLLVMMVESGVGMDQAFRTFAQGEGRAAPLTRAATELMVRDLDRGAPYELALERWAERLAAPGAQDLARVITRATQHGTPLGPVLKDFSREFGELRVARAREAIGRTSAKMTLAMLILIMPALFIVLAGPAVATLGKSIRMLSGAE